MNNNYLVDFNYILKCNFKHRSTYFMLCYVVANYNKNNNLVTIVNKDIFEKYYLRDRAINDGLDELRNYDIICRSKINKRTFIVNFSVFAKAVKIDD